MFSKKNMSSLVKYSLSQLYIVFSPRPLLRIPHLICYHYSSVTYNQNSWFPARFTLKRFYLDLLCRYGMSLVWDYSRFGIHLNSECSFSHRSLALKRPFGLFRSKPHLLRPTVCLGLFHLDWI